MLVRGQRGGQSSYSCSLQAALITAAHADGMGTVHATPLAPLRGPVPTTALLTAYGSWSSCCSALGPPGQVNLSVSTWDTHAQLSAPAPTSTSTSCSRLRPWWSGT